MPTNLQQLITENARLRAELNLFESAIVSAIGGNDYLDPPDGGDVPLPEQVQRMRAERDALRAELVAARSDRQQLSACYSSLSHENEELLDRLDATQRERDVLRIDLHKARAELAAVNVRANEWKSTAAQEREWLGEMTEERDALLGPAEPYKQINDMKAENGRLRAELHNAKHHADARLTALREVEEELMDAEAERDALRAELAAANVRIKDLENEGESMVIKVGAASDALADVETQRAQLQSIIEGHRDIFSEINALCNEFGTVAGERHSDALRKIITELRAELAACDERVKIMDAALNTVHAELAAANEKCEWRANIASMHEDDNDALRAKLAALRAALEPFADAAWPYTDEDDGYNEYSAEAVVTIGDLRRARNVLKETGGE